MSSETSLTSEQPPATSTAQLFSGLRIVSLCTMLSRVLGLIRDIGMATVFGNGPTMDAFSVAFRIPNLARRLFGEGALTAAFLPVFLREIEQSGKESAWKLASAIFMALAMTLSGLVLAGELLLWLVSAFGDLSLEAELLVNLTAVLLPYLILICMAAQISAVLHALGHFTWPALLPVILNVAWIGCIWWIAPLLDSAPERAIAVSICIVSAGFLQLLAPLPTLHRLGFRFDKAFASSRGKVTEIGRALLPIVIGLSVTQLNTLVDSLIAWGFAPSAGSTALMTWLPTQPEFPLQPGTASALYFGQRMYQFPLGVFGVALGTVLFPLLSRHAGRERFDLLCKDLSLGLRLVVCIGFPASVGLILLATPLTELFFHHGAFDSHDAQQTAQMISAYGIAVWAYCGLLIIHRGFYAIGDRQTPMRVGLMAVAVNLVLDFTLIWFLGGKGLALATAISAMFQVAMIAWFIQRRIGPMNWREIAATTLRALIATTIMAIVCLQLLEHMPFGEFPIFGEGLLGRAMHLLIPLLAAVVIYFAIARLLGMKELWLLFHRGKPDSESDS